MRTWLAGLLLLLALPVSATYAPFTVEIQDDFADGVTLAATEKGAEAIWTTTAVAGTTVSETGGNFQVTSNGATSARARIQTKPNYRTNFFVQPLKFTYTGLDFTGTPAQAGQEDFYFYLSSTAELETTAEDFVLLSTRGSGRTEITTKIDGGTVTSLFVNTPGWTPTGATFVIDETSYFVTLTTATQQATFSGAHGLDVADWGTRGDSAIALSGRHLITPADGNTAIVVLSSFRVENLKLFEAFVNGDLEDTGSRIDFWTNAGTVAEAGNVRTITGVGSSIGKLSKDFNFFGQKLKYRVKMATSFPAGLDASNKIRFAVNSQAAGSLASDESFAVAFNPEASGYRMRAGWKTGNATAVPETTNVALNLAMATLPASFDLTLDRDDYSIAAFTSAGVAIDLNGATAGTTLTGSHNINWIVWGPGNVPPQTANSAIVLENTGSTAGTVSTWGRVQVERLDPYWLVPTVYGPVADVMELEVAGDLDPVDHPLLASGYLDVTASPFSADDTGAVDATNALNHAINFARENHLSGYAECDGEYLVSDKIVSFQALQLRTTHDLADSPNNDEEGPTVFVGESNCVTPPKLILADNSAGFNSTGSPKPVLQFWARNYNNYPTEVNDNLPGISFSNQIIGIDIDLDAVANDGACGISMQGAQGTTIEEVTVDATGAFSGICGLPGGGGAMVDIEVIGGATCIWGVAGPGGAAGSLMQPTITGLTCNGAPVRYDGLQTLVLVGADLTVPNGTPCIDARGGTGSGGVLLGKVSLIDSVCKFASANAPTNNGMDVDASFYIKNSYFQYADNIAVSGGGNLVSGQQAGWTHITEAAKGIDPGLYTPPTPDAQFRHTRYDNGTRTLAGNDLFEETVDEAPPGDLQSQHLLASWPAWETASVPAGLEADFTGDQTTDIQASLTANAVTFLPRGIYAVSAGLDQGTNDLLGAGRVFTQIVTKKEVGSFDTGVAEPIITTTCDDASQAKLGNMRLNAQAQNINLAPTPDVGGSYAVNWCAGDSVIRNIDLSRNSQFGYGNPTGTGGGAADWQMVLFSANAGGKIYDLQYGEAFNHGPLWRHFKVDGTSNPLHFYHLNPEHAHGEANTEVVNSENVHIYGMKAEANLPILWIRDSDNVNMYGYGGNGSAFEPDDDYDDDPPNSVDDPTKGPFPPTFTVAIPSLFRVWNTPNYRLAGLFDQVRLPSVPEDDHAVFGHGQPPENWHMASEKPPGSMVESVTLKLDRPILISRVTITTPPEEIVSIAGSAVVNNGQSYAAAAGTERAVVWAASAALGTALIDFQSATYAAQAMAVRVEGRRTTGTSGRSVSFSDVLEANLPSGASAITGTWDVAPGTNDGWGLTLDGVDQSAPVRDADSAECATAASCTLPAMTVMAGDLVLALCQVAPGGVSIAASAGYTVLFNTAAPLTAVMVKSITADGTETPGCVYGGAANSVMAGVVYAVATDAGTAIVVLKRRRE